jgi:adenylate kinase
MRAVVTGQVGLDKRPFLERAAALARGEGFDVTVCHVGEMMYAEAPDVAAGKILDLPLGRLQSLRRSVFKDILSTCRTCQNVIVNTHATFRWRHGLFYAFDYDQMKELNADVYVTLVDNVDRVHWRLTRDGHLDHSLKDLMVWREEEILATELLSQIVGGHRRFYVVARGDDGPSQGDARRRPEDDARRKRACPEPHDDTARALVGLLFRPQIRKAYLSFPMSHVADSPPVMAAIETFRREMKRRFVCFDPGDLEEKYLNRLALQAAEAGHRSVELGPPDRRVTVDTADLVSIIPDIDGQIYARDFKLIDQSDMIASLIPALADGRPALSSGVERELQHAHEATRDVFVIWCPESQPSPFVTETATRVFRSTQEAMQFFTDGGYVPASPVGTLFG